MSLSNAAPRVPQFTHMGHQREDGHPERCDERVPNDYTSSFDHRCAFKWKHIVERDGNSYNLCARHYAAHLRKGRLP